MAKKNNKLDEIMNDEEIVTIDITHDDGVTTCIVAAILEVDEKEYVALLPIDENGDYSPEEAWFYRYFENEDPNEDPTIESIDNEEEYEAVTDKYDEFLDEIIFEEMNGGGDEE